MNSDVLFQLAPDPSRKYEKAGDLVNGDKQRDADLHRVCTDKEFESRDARAAGRFGVPPLYL